MLVERRSDRARQRWTNTRSLGAPALLVSCMLPVLLFVSACGRKKGVQLPPAQGEGAAPLPALPSIPKDERAGGDAGPGTISVAGTEGHTTGTTFPRAEAQLAAKATGVIEKVFVNEGDRVRRGMVLFRQETRNAELQVEQAKAAREAARVNAKAVEAEWTRSKSLVEQKAISRMEWDQAQARFDSARVAVQQADVALAMADKVLADATVRSPIDGLVTAKLRSEGDTATMMPPTVVLVVQDQSTLELRFRLPEKALRQVKVGDTVIANFEALAQARQAKVARISSTLDAQTRTVEVVGMIPNRDGALKSGLLAEVEIGAGGHVSTASNASADAGPRSGNEAGSQAARAPTPPATAEGARRTGKATR